MKLTNRLGLPDAFVRAVQNDTYDAGVSDITTTQLISAPRLVQLKKRHNDKIVTDVSDRIWMLFGSACHEVLDRSERVALTEERVYLDVNGSLVGCQFDRLALSNNLLQDYKVTSVWSVMNGAKPEWISQLNVLAYVCRENWYEVDKLQIVTILRDWRRGEAQQNKDYPPHHIHVIDIPLWTNEVAKAYIEERVAMHKEAAELSDENLPDCTKVERWVRGESWAVMKDQNKRATKVFFNEPEAGLYASEKNTEQEGKKKPSKYFVTFRRGESLRCSTYCEVSEFCSQWKQIQAEAQTKESPKEIPLTTMQQKCDDLGPVMFLDAWRKAKCQSALRQMTDEECERLLRYANMEG